MDFILNKDILVSSQAENYSTHIQLANHQLVADEPESKGGKDTGPNPYQLLLASLGSCSAITIRMYAQNKKWEIGTVDIKLNMAQVQREKEKVTIIIRKISLGGNLDSDQRERLLAVAKACPVAKILTGNIEIESSLEN